MSKEGNTATALTIAVPIVVLSVVNKKLQKLKSEGKLTSVSSLIKATPVVFRTLKYAFIEKKIKKNHYFMKSGPNFDIYAPSFKLKDHWTCRDTDVLCAVPAKSGTGWAQQICQQLRVGGDTNVNYNQDLLDVQPWIDAHFTEMFGPNDERPIKPDPAAGPGAFDLNADHVDSSIRVFKSHLTWKNLEGTNCKKLYFYRHSIDCLYSAYRFFCLQILEIDSCSPHQFATIKIMQGFFEDSLENLCDFWEHRNDPNVGFFFYDDVKEDHAGSVKRIAELMGIEPLPELIEKVVEQSTVKFMSSEEHHHRFDEFSNIACLKRALGLDYSYMPAISGKPPKGPGRNLKIAKGGGLGNADSKKKTAHTGKHEVEACFYKTWDRIVLARTGFADLSAMRAAWKKERSQ